MNREDMRQDWSDWYAGQLTRRMLLKKAGYGIGTVALASLLAEEGSAQSVRDPLAARKPHFAPRAKRVIFLFMAGAPSQIDLFDPKPMLQKHDGEAIPEEFVKGERFAFIKGTPKLLGSPHTFKKCGQSGAEIGDLLPHLQGIADDITILRGMKTDQFNHAPAQLFMNCGHQLPGRPSLGSWVSYGLGTTNRDLPAFVVMMSGQNNPDGGKSCWGSGFMPSAFQGVEFRSKGDPVLFLSDPDGIDRETKAEQIAHLAKLNRMRQGAVPDPELEARIASYELAFRMQESVPELTDMSREKPETLEMYGAKPGERSFANNCLLARRMVERGVRFVQLYHRGWDHHGEVMATDLKTALPKLCRETDQPAVALIKDLKQRGLLDETLVIWAGEFGRTPMNEERDGSKFPGRDHHPHAFTIWMAGGGLKPGVTFGETDELGYQVVDGEVHVHDLNATILHLLGLDHTRLTYPYLGRDFRLTDVHGRVVDEILR